MTRCGWAQTEPSVTYHDEEWGEPVTDDRMLFEFITLEGAQAGLSWEIVLKKRETYRSLFANFDPAIVSDYTQDDIERILLDPGVVRNRLKISSTVTNARAFLEIQHEFGSFSSYLWKFVDNQPIVNTHNSMSSIPVSTPLSDALSKDLKKRGFRFVGTTICYAFMQAIGMVNDHSVDCFRYEQLKDRKPYDS